MATQDNISASQFMQHYLSARQSQGTLFDSPREYNYSTGQQEKTIGRPWTERPDYASGGTPVDYAMKDQPEPKPAPEIGSMSSGKTRLPPAPPGNQRQKTDYGVGPGFPRNAQNGGRQGHLFAHEAPARDQNARQHIGYAKHYNGGIETGQGIASSAQRDKLVAYDTRIAGGSLTGRYDPDTPLYHGTKKALKGDQIEPGMYKAGDRVGQKKGLAKNGRRVNAYATPDEDLARGYTKTSKNKPGKAPKVYQVKPTGPVSADLEYLSPVSPHERVDAVKGGVASLPAVKSPRPFKVVREV